MKISIQKFIQPGVPLGILLIFLCVFIFGINFVTREYFQAMQTHSTVFGEIESIVSWNKLTIEFSGLILLLLNTFLLTQLNTKYSLIRSRTFLHAFLFLMSVSVWSAFDISATDHLAVTFLLISLLMFMGMYRDKFSIRNAFTGSMFIGISSFFSPPLIYLLPAIWIGFFMFQCMNLRIFLASISGIFTPWIFYLSINLHFQPEDLWLNELKNNLSPSFPDTFLPIYVVIFASITLILLLIGIGGFFNSLRFDSIQIRQRMKLFLWLLLFSVLIGVFFSAKIPVFLAISAISFSMIMAHTLTLQKNLLNSLLLIILILVNIAFVVINYLYHTGVWS